MNTLETSYPDQRIERVLLGDVGHEVDSQVIETLWRADVVTHHDVFIESRP